MANTLVSDVARPSSAMLMIICRGKQFHAQKAMYRQVSNVRRTLVGNNIVDNSDVVGASPVGAAPTTSSLST